MPVRREGRDRGLRVGIDPKAHTADPLDELGEGESCRSVMGGGKGGRE